MATKAERMAQVFKDEGFEVWNTGGGCTAYGKQIDKHDPAHVLITSVDGAEIPTRPNDPVYLGVYFDDAEVGLNMTVPSYGLAIALAKTLVIF